MNNCRDDPVGSWYSMLVKKKEEERIRAAHAEPL